MPSSPFDDVKRALRDYQTQVASTFGQTERNVVAEIDRRLSRLGEQYVSLMELNEKLIKSDGFTTSFDPVTDIMTFQVGDQAIRLKLNREDPNVPIQQKGSTSISAYNAGQKPPPHLEESEPLRLQLEEWLESFYHSAHRVLKLVKQLPGLRSFECRAITIVRNKLVEHPDESESYSFGYGTSGPVVRPIMTPGREWRDEGLISNTKAFADALQTAFASERPTGAA